MKGCVFGSCFSLSRFGIEAVFDALVVDLLLGSNFVGFSGMRLLSSGCGTANLPPPPTKPPTTFLGFWRWRFHSQRASQTKEPRPCWEGARVTRVYGNSGFGGLGWGGAEPVTVGVWSLVTRGAQDAAT